MAGCSVVRAHVDGLGVANGADLPEDVCVGTTPSSEGHTGFGRLRTRCSCRAGQTAVQIAGERGSRVDVQ
jgi:hypothetical protein